MLAVKFNKQVIGKTSAGYIVIAIVVSYCLFTTLGYSNSVSYFVAMAVTFIYSLQVNKKMNGTLQELIINGGTIKFCYQNRFKDPKTFNRNDIDLKFGDDDTITFYHCPTKKKVANI